MELSDSVLEYKNEIINDLRQKHPRIVDGSAVGAWCGIMLNHFTKEELLLIVAELGEMTQLKMRT